MKVKRTTVSLPRGLYERAQAAMRDQDFTSFSDYVQYLIREDARVRGGYIVKPMGGKDNPSSVVVVDSAPTDPTLNEISSRPVRYQLKKTK